MGATKAGTSWLYRALADRSDVALSAVKETHFWDTRSPVERQAQIEIFQRQGASFEAGRREAESKGQGWKVRNMTRRASDMARLVAMLKEGSIASYLEYLEAPASGETRLLGDICPAYGLLPATTFEEMASAAPGARFLYLVREPVARLWSAVRMQADRQLQPGEDFEQKAHNILQRILNRGAERHITDRGDYAATIERLRSSVPQDSLKVMYFEDLVTEAGYRHLCHWLGLAHAAAPISEKVHEGRGIAIRADLATRAAHQLASQYRFAAEEIGPLPDAWKAYP